MLGEVQMEEEENVIQTLHMCRNCVRIRCTKVDSKVLLSFSDILKSVYEVSEQKRLLSYIAEEFEMELDQFPYIRIFNGLDKRFELHVAITPIQAYWFLASRKNSSNFYKELAKSIREELIEEFFS